jgi:hypothetical protein
VRDLAIAIALAAGACGGGGGTGGDAPPGGGDGPVDAGALPAECNPISEPLGAVIEVGPGEAAQLPAIVFAAAAGTTIVLADGTYVLPATLQLRAANVTLRSASGDPAAVILDAAYTVAEAILVTAPSVTIGELTVTRAVDHLVHVVPPDGGPDIVGFLLYRVRLIDGGEQFLKVNPGAARDAWADSGAVECSEFILTDEGRLHVERDPGGCYTGGIDVHSGRAWVISGNRFDSIYCAGEGLAEHAVHFWVGARDTLVENNLIVNCARGIGFGLGDAGNGQSRDYPDDPYPGVGYIGHYDGLIRNNAIWADVPWFDTGIGLEQARGARVIHNTVVSADSVTGFFSSIDYRFPNSVVALDNNLVRRVTERDGGTATRGANAETSDLSLFVDAASGDLHLAASATIAIDQGIAVPDSGVDLDGQPHSVDGAPDLGADER